MEWVKIRMGRYKDRERMERDKDRGRMGIEMEWEEIRIGKGKRQPHGCLF